jgi:hypothetical protein
MVLLIEYAPRLPLLIVALMNEFYSVVSFEMPAQNATDKDTIPKGRILFTSSQTHKASNPLLFFHSFFAFQPHRSFSSSRHNALTPVVLYLFNIARKSSTHWYLNKIDNVNLTDYF